MLFKKMFNEKTRKQKLLDRNTLHLPPLLILLFRRPFLTSNVNLIEWDWGRGVRGWGKGGGGVVKQRWRKECACFTILKLVVLHTIPLNSSLVELEAKG